MGSTSSVILDPASDKAYVELARLSQLYSFPDFVKSAAMESTMHPNGVAVTTYADPRRRLYPCHSAAATWLCGLYFQEKKAEFHPKDQARIQQRIEHYVDYFDIRGAYDAMVKRAGELRQGNPLPDSAYAYVWNGEDGGKERYLPLTSPMEVKVAADWLERYRDRLPYSDRNVIAGKILEKAAHFGAALTPVQTEFLERQAGHGLCDPAEVHEAILQRARLTKSAAHRQEILKLAQLVKGQPREALQPQQLVKLATTLDVIDQALGLGSKYTESIRRPEEVVFKVTLTKAAADHASLCALTSGTIYAKEQFAKLAREDVEALFGSDFAGEVSRGFQVDGEKMAELAHTLPRPDAELLDRLMSESNLHPQLTKSSADARLTPAELETLAATYGVG